MKRILSALSLLLVLTAGLALAAGPSADQIMATLKRGFVGVNDYQADVSLTVKGSKISINDMRMTVYYKKPNKVHVEAKQGMAMVPSGNFFGNPATDLANGAQPVYLRSEKKMGRDCHVIKLAKPNAGANAPSVTLWVDKQNMVMVAVETSKEMGVKSAWRYDKIDGRYYLPVEIRADLRTPAGSSEGQAAQAVIKFSNYRVNKGISDKLFEAKPKK